MTTACGVGRIIMAFLFVIMPRKSSILQMCMNILNGSIPPGANFNMKALVEELFSYLESETLPFALFKVCCCSVFWMVFCLHSLLYYFQQALSPMVNRLPDKYSSKIKEIVEVDALENFALVKVSRD